MLSNRTSIRSKLADSLKSAPQKTMGVAECFQVETEKCLLRRGKVSISPYELTNAYRTAWSK